MNPTLSLFFVKEETSRPVALEHMKEHYRKLSQSSFDGFDEEFSELAQVSSFKYTLESME